MGRRFIFTLLCLLGITVSLSAQSDRKEVRHGNRDFNNANYKEAELHYRRALVQDSTSFAAAYNLANTLYQKKDYQGAKNSYDLLSQSVPDSGHAAEYYFNKGDNDLQLQDYKAAVEDFRQALLIAPDDLAAKESYIYAKKKLEQQNRQQDQQQDQNSQDQNNDQNPQDRDQNQDQNRQQPDNQDNKDENGQQPQPQISQQQAQQMLKAIQAKEKETQDKVEKAKAAQVKSRQKEKNW